MDKPSAILLVGPHGVGKGTQARYLKAIDGFYHYSSGDAFRNLDSSTDLGKKIHDIIAAGEYVSDSLVMDVMDDSLMRAQEQGQYDPQSDYLLLDGVPRTVGQIEPITDRFEIVQILLFCGVTDNKLLKRMNKRTLLEGRIDDSDENSLKKLSKYREETVPMLKEFDERLRDMVYANRSPFLVYQDLISFIKHPDIPKSNS